MNQSTVTAMPPPTSHLPANDTRKFSKRTPNYLKKAYKRIWDPELGPGGRIEQDVTRVIDETYLAIFLRRGRVLDTSAYKGRRADVHEERVAKPWGGGRKRGSGVQKLHWLHYEVEQCERELVKATREAFALSQVSQ